MAFFGLTQIGYQNRVRQYTLRPDYTTEQWMRREQKPGGTDITPLPPIAGYVPPRRSIVPKSQTSGYGAGPGVQGEESWKEHMRLRFKHCRNPKDPIQLYSRPITTTQDVAAWRKDEPLHKREPWTYVPRHSHVNSEMTKFVHDMQLTNREFSLY